jgi:WD40 repeat protein
MADTVTQSPEPQDAPLGDRPYRGLGYYTEADARWFFGRTTERNVIIAHLRTARLTLLYAESGVGKSSLLRAGVTARLREVAEESLEEGEPPEFIPVVFKQWKDDPVKYLIAEIETQARFWSNKLAGAGQSQPRSTSRVRQTPREKLAAKISDAAEPLGATFLIILDQFEELFASPAHQERLAEELAACVNSPGVSANFLIAVREDAYGRVGELFDARIRNVYGNYLHLEHLTHDAARDAIERPVDIYNAMRQPPDRIKLEPGLTDAVLGAVGAGKLSLTSGGDERAGLNAGTPNGGGIEAPFLQLVMERVWDCEMEHRSGALRERTLTDLGGPAAIVRGHLDRALADLSSSQELEAATDIFSDLVTPSGAKIAYAAGDLAERHGHSLATVDTVLSKLDTKRIVRETDAAPGGADPRYEIYHDRLAQPILAWGRKQRAARLEREKRDAEREAEARRDELRRFRRRTFSLAAVAAIALVALITVALLLYANSQHQAALNQARIARVLALGVDSQQNLSTRPDVALSFALAAYRLRPRSAESSMIAALEGFRRTGGLAILHGDSDAVNSVAFSRDGRTMATGSGDKAIRLWNVRTRQEIGRPLVGPGTTGVLRVAFSPDGQLLASAGGYDGTVRFWSVRTHSQIGPALRTDAGKGAYLYSVALSRDGRTLASAGHNSGVFLWDVRTHREIAQLRCRCIGETSVAFSPDGRTLASAGYDGAVRFWNLVTHQQVARIDGLQGAIYAIAFRPGGHVLAYAGPSGRIGLLPANRRPGTPLTGHSGPVIALAFSASGELASTSADSTVRLWSVGAHRELGAPLTGHAGTVLGVAFSPDGRTLASTGSDGTIRLWDARAGRRLGDPLPGRAGAVYSLALSRDGETIASGGNEGDVTLWHAGSDNELHRLMVAHGGPVRSVAFSPDGQIVAAGTHNGDVALWNAASGSRVATLTGKRPVIAVSFSPDGRTLAAGDDNGAVTLWDVPRHSVVGRLATHQSTVHSIVFGSNGMLVTAGDEAVEVWNPRNRVRLELLRASNAPVDTVAVSSDGRVLATAGDDKTIHLWDLNSGIERGTLSGSTGAIYGVALSPDGHTVASAGADNLVRLWDTRTRSELGPPFPDHQDTVYGMAFSPDGRTLFSGGGDGTVRVWTGIFWRSLPDLEHLTCGLIGTGLSAPEWSSYAHGLPFQRSC